MAASIRSVLDGHIAEKSANREWLRNCLDGNTDCFPYQPRESGTPTFDRINHVPPRQSKRLPAVSADDTAPLYLVNIPLAHRPGDIGHAALRKILNLFNEQAFGMTAGESQRAGKKRLAIVIGVNQIRSIDSAVNRAFTSFIASTPRVGKIAARVLGFYWYPKWGRKVQFSAVRGLYARRKAYRILKALSPVKAEKTRKALEGDGSLHPRIVSQIPFQNIRQRILRSSCTKDFASHFENAPNAPMYFTVMDADCIALRNHLGGLFTRMDRNIAAQDCPSAISLGYSLAAGELATLKFGVRLEMKVREATTSVVPFGSYLPEPHTGFLVRKAGGRSQISRLSFLGDGRTIENRRLIQNGIASGVFDGKGLLIADGGVVMGTPGRMHTETAKKAKKVTPAIVKQKQFLRTLRGISQSHIFPKQWADNLYVALGFSSGSVTDVTKYLMRLFAVYDPINRMFSEPGRYSGKVFDRVINSYQSPLSDGLQNTLDTARTRLWGLGMPRNTIDLAAEAARKAGEAMYLFLKEAAGLA